MSKQVTSLLLYPHKSQKEEKAADFDRGHQEAG
jgi:hypothetical protein